MATGKQLKAAIRTGRAPIMARPKRTQLQEIRVRVWFFAVAKAANMTATEIETVRDDSSKKWHKYKIGRHVPTKNFVEQIEEQYRETKHILEYGPPNLWRAAEVKSLQEGFDLLKPGSLEKRYRKFNSRFLAETRFRGPPAQWISAFSAWLRRIGKSECKALPLAVSANLIAMRCLDEYGLAEIIYEGAEALNVEYGLCLQDFANVSPDLHLTLLASMTERNIPIPEEIRGRRLLRHNRQDEPSTL
jgi:hypothetical protein